MSITLNSCPKHVNVLVFIIVLPQAMRIEVTRTSRRLIRGDNPLASALHAPHMFWNTVMPGGSTPLIDVSR
jgi:hypothetical protein